MSDDPFRDRLPTRAELDALPHVRCPLCGIVHHGMSREDYDALLSQGARDLARAIDAHATRLVYGDYHR